MRILGFSKKWNKLSQKEFATFRYPRVDKDWYIGEKVQIIIQPRKKGGGEKLGIAEIVNKEIRELDPFFQSDSLITDKEAIEDGFDNREDMVDWMQKTYGLDYISAMHKLTLRWL